MTDYVYAQRQKERAPRTNTMLSKITDRLFGFLLLTPGLMVVGG